MDMSRRGGGRRAYGSRVVGTLVAVIATCLGCTSAATTVAVTDTDPPLLVHNVHGGADEALIEGHLRYLDHAGGFVLEWQREVDQLFRNVPVWPPGTRPALKGDDLVGVDVPGVGVIALGDWVSGAGGYASPETCTLDLPEVPTECLSEGGEFAMLHDLSSMGDGP